ncbi:hypothetical protein NL466_27265, partial [Klebsiella pneumoniae]|nr:hypothetical protein [Klebsiella pneumoniae]
IKKSRVAERNTVSVSLVGSEYIAQVISGIFIFILSDAYGYMKMATLPLACCDITSAAPFSVGKRRLILAPDAS